MLKPYKITEEGKEKPFIWCNKKLEFLTSRGAREFMNQLKKDYPYIKFEIKYNL